MHVEEPLVAAMLRPEFYPHATAPEIHLVQTHISYVFLTGDYAYKVKKPVDLGFLDFTTVESRKHYCAREVTLNRQFAPHLYLDVVSIFEEDGAYSLTGDAAPVEYAVKMRQFREEDVLLGVFERGDLSESDVEELGAQLAALHAAAPSSEAIAAYGAPERVWKMAEDNLEQVRSFVGETLTEAQFVQLRAGMLRRYERNRATLDERAKTGRIRECHGDLHLNNICRFEGRLQLFDRIEFNETFKNIDVLYDLSFLLMDLRFRGRPDLATILLNVYLEESGDYDGVVLLPLYVGMRALIRGMVASFLSRETHIEDAERRAAREEATRYFAFAETALASSRGFLAITCGVSGSGKSYAARFLTPRLEAIWIRSDALRKHLAGVSLREHGGAIYSEEQTQATYGELTRLAKVLVGEGHALILDATYRQRSLRSDVAAVAREVDAPIAIVYCSARDEVLSARIRSRAGDVSDATEGVMRAQQEEFQVPTADEADAVLHVDTSDPISLEQAEARLRRLIPPNA